MIDLDTLLICLDCCMLDECLACPLNNIKDCKKELLKNAIEQLEGFVRYAEDTAEEVSELYSELCSDNS